jgi:hypothetical protein
MRRTIAVVVISVCLAVGAAACSAEGPVNQQPGSSQPDGSQGGSSAGGTEQAMTVMRQLAHCIRSHGMPAFPDPVINPLTNGPDFPRMGDASSPAACRQAGSGVWADGG